MADQSGEQYLSLPQHIDDVYFRLLNPVAALERQMDALKMKIDSLHETIQRQQDHITKGEDAIKSFVGGIIRNLEVQIGNAPVPVDFHVLDIKLNWISSLLLGRAFMATVGAVFDMQTNKLCLTLIDPNVYYDPIPSYYVSRPYSPAHSYIKDNIEELIYDIETWRYKMFDEFYRHIDDVYFRLLNPVAALERQMEALKMKIDSLHETIQRQQDHITKGEDAIKIFVGLDIHWIGVLMQVWKGLIYIGSESSCKSGRCAFQGLLILGPVSSLTVVILASGFDSSAQISGFRAVVLLAPCRGWTLDQNRCAFQGLLILGPVSSLTVVILASGFDSSAQISGFRAVVLLAPCRGWTLDQNRFSSSSP
ncbi:hypothetical protein F2Q68_00034582 [Brassica cretica]|uniref:Uncharacterized protein n=1 Tax=Brassica cretica TaxID=69181 RepID=A0A8S9HC94_BRACR|nr:hypothetical protein F2Q68_00034582 [Brassica cretica]